MKVLIVGGGGREHALAWKIAQSPRVKEVFVAPGNAGTRSELKVNNININAQDIDTLLSFAMQNAIDLTIVGPEAPLVAGIVDRFTDSGLRCFGPNKAAAQLEGSKSFSKDFLSRYNIPTAAFGSFSDLYSAESYLREHGSPIVVKADGLAAGKGVTVAMDEEQAVAALKDCLQGNRFGSAGNKVVIEEFLTGEEASFMCMVDGKHILPLASSQDHKARDNRDKGPNTGGMGAYSPAPVITDAVHTRIMREVIEPTVAGLAKEGMPYTGFLYAGLMVAEDGAVQVLEYNCRFGDPETQPVLMRLKTDLLDLCDNALDGNLQQASIEWDPRVALGVVMVATGYPEAYEKGRIISGLDQAESDSVKTFHAGTRIQNNNIVTDGGRVLCVTALGESTFEAQEKAYYAVGHIHWDGVYYRTDIGYRAISREKSKEQSLERKT